jgi:type IV secretion system protein VirB1
MLLELTFMAQMLNECQNEVPPSALIGLVTNNPYTISVMGAETATPPESEGEATAVIDDLRIKGIAYNTGMMKIHSSNFQLVGLDNSNAFNICDNIKAGAMLLSSCLGNSTDNNSQAIADAYICYRKKNFLPPISTPMQLSPQDQNLLSQLEADTPQPENNTPQKKAEPWDVFEDFNH